MADSKSAVVQPIDQYTGTQRALDMPPIVAQRLRDHSLFQGQTQDRVCKILEDHITRYGKALVEQLLTYYPQAYPDALYSMEARQALLAQHTALTPLVIQALFVQDPFLLVCPTDRFSTVLERLAVALPSPRACGVFVQAHLNVFRDLNNTHVTWVCRTDEFLAWKRSIGVWRLGRSLHPNYQSHKECLQQLYTLLDLPRALMLHPAASPAPKRPRLRAKPNPPKAAKPLKPATPRPPKPSKAPRPVPTVTPLQAALREIYGHLDQAQLKHVTRLFAGSEDTALAFIQGLRQHGWPQQAVQEALSSARRRKTPLHVSSIPRIIAYQRALCACGFSKMHAIHLLIYANKIFQIPFQDLGSSLSAYRNEALSQLASRIQNNQRSLRSTPKENPPPKLPNPKQPNLPPPFPPPPKAPRPIPVEIALQGALQSPPREETPSRPREGEGTAQWQRQRQFASWEQQCAKVNTTAEAFRAAGWSLKDRDAHLATFPAITRLSPPILALSLLQLAQDIGMRGRTWTRQLLQMMERVETFHTKLWGEEPRAGWEYALVISLHRLSENPVPLLEDASPSPAAVAWNAATAMARLLHAYSTAGSYQQLADRQREARRRLRKAPEWLAMDCRALRMALVFQGWDLSPPIMRQNLDAPWSPVILLEPPKQVLTAVRLYRRIATQHYSSSTGVEEFDPLQDWQRLCLPFRELQQRWAFIATLPRPCRSPVNAKTLAEMLYTPRRAEFLEQITVLAEEVLMYWDPDDDTEEEEEDAESSPET